MCYFFSFITEPENHGGKRFYFNKEQRGTVAFLANNNVGGFDSHSSIAKFYGLNEDKCNKYEFDPYKNKFTIDRIGAPVDDSIQIEEWVRSLNFEKEIISVPAKKKCRNFSFHAGDVVIFLSLEEIKVKKHIACGWNEKMNHFAEKNVEIVITSEMVNEYEYGEDAFCKIGDWYISTDMVTKKP
jgi:hypothetical protein